MIYLNENEELIAHTANVTGDEASAIAREAASSVSYRTVYEFIRAAGFESESDRLFQNWQGGRHHQFQKSAGALVCYTEESEKETAETASEMIDCLLAKQVKLEVDARSEVVEDSE